MDPPFSKQANINHIMHAADFLKPDGRLVAVMSAGIEFRETAKSTFFRAFVDELGGQFLSLPEGAFKSSGTMVRTVILTFAHPETEQKAAA